MITSTRIRYAEATRRAWLRDQTVYASLTLLAVSILALSIFVVL